MKVIKANGEETLYDPEKIVRSLGRVGASQELIQEVLSETEKELYEGIHTKAMYKIVFRNLRKLSRGVASKYHLKNAIMELGPTGFPFEKFIASLLNAEGYKTLGSFRTFGHVPLNVRNKWHYSGTFYSVRAKYLNRPVKDGYGGVEIWPGEHFTAGQCWNEFADNRPLKAQYDFRFMYPRTIDDQMQWEVDRLGGPRCEQHKRELDWFLNYVKPDDKILVIGSKHGGLEHQIRKSKKDV